VPYRLVARSADIGDVTAHSAAVFRTEYEGTTLREHLGLPEPRPVRRNPWAAS
jgi:hypothetical protein